MRDLLSWAEEIEREMNSEKVVRDVNSVDRVRARHEELRAEIETRQDRFNAVIRTGEDMIQKEHYAKDEVWEKKDRNLDLHLCSVADICEVI